MSFGASPDLGGNVTAMAPCVGGGYSGCLNPLDSQDYGGPSQVVGKPPRACPQPGGSCTNPGAATAPD